VPELHFLRDVLIIFTVSIGVVFLFQKLRLPSIAGFLVAGTLVGPYGLNLVSDRGQVEALAEVGVILLLFTIGLEFSLKQMKSSRRLLMVGGSIQVTGAVGLGTLAGLIVGLPIQEAFFWGLLLSLSSTAIVFKALGERGEADTVHGRSTIGILIFQDLAVVPMILITPLLAGLVTGGIQPVALTLVKSFVAVILIVIGARVVAPWVLGHIARVRSRELFLLTIIVLGLGTAWLTSLVGLSLALGAFIAGLLISESEYSHQALAEILPFRDSFISLFFVSIGMLMDVRVLLNHPVLILTLVAVVLTGKLFSGAVAVLAAGAPLRSAILGGVALAQVGEFAFILAQEGQRVGLLAPSAYNLFLSLSVISMIITPFLIQWSPKLARRTEALQRLKRWWPTRLPAQPETPQVKVRDHVIIVGYGLNGRNLSRVLHEMEIPYIVLDIGADLVQSASKAGVPILYGDATNLTVLKQAGIEQARVLVIAASDPFGARRMVKQARGLNPNLHIMVRTRYLKELQELHDLGANEVIPEEFETSIEIFTLVLKTYRVPQPVILQKAEHIRREGYALLRRGELPELAHHLRGGTLADVDVETCRIEEDSPALGKSLGEVGIHRRTGSSIMALTRNGVTQSNPPMNLVLDSGDVLVILGSREQVRKAIALILDTKTIDS